MSGDMLGDRSGRRIVVTGEYPRTNINAWFRYWGSMVSTIEILGFDPQPLALKFRQKFDDNAGEAA